jgi:hypothetical protein
MGWSRRGCHALSCLCMHSLTHSVTYSLCGAIFCLQVLDEIGIGLNAQMTSAPANRVQQQQQQEAAGSRVAEGPMGAEAAGGGGGGGGLDEDLQARLDNLRKP